MGVLALSGIAAHMGDPDRPPVGMGTLHTDFTLAPIAAAGLMAALLQREETGRGQFLEIAQYEGAVHLLDTELIDALVNGVVAPRLGNRSAEFVPHGIYRTAGDDRWVAIVARDRDEWAALCACIDRPDLADRADLQELEGRRAAESEIDDAISAWTSTRDEWEVADDLQRRGIPASPLENVADQVERDEGMRGYYLEDQRGEVPFLAHQQPFTWNGERLPTRPSPGLGEHNVEILQGELGLDSETVADLVIREIVH
jgi:benzylsuccinate CoA-transferase BbsF subunit